MHFDTIYSLLQATGIIWYVYVCVIVYKEARSVQKGGRGRGDTRLIKVHAWGTSVALDLGEPE